MVLFSTTGLKKSLSKVRRVLPCWMTSSGSGATKLSTLADSAMPLARSARRNLSRGICRRPKSTEFLPPNTWHYSVLWRRKSRTFSNVCSAVTPASWTWTMSSTIWEKESVQENDNNSWNAIPVEFHLTVCNICKEFHFFFQYVLVLNIHLFLDFSVFCIE